MPHHLASLASRHQGWPAAQKATGLGVIAFLALVVHRLRRSGPRAASIFSGAVDLGFIAVAVLILLTPNRITMHTGLRARNRLEGRPLRCRTRPHAQRSTRPSATQLGHSPSPRDRFRPGTSAAIAGEDAERRGTSRHGLQPFPTALRDLPAEVGRRPSRPGARALRDEIAQHVVRLRRRTGGRPDLRRCPEDVGLAAPSDRWSAGSALLPRRRWGSGRGIHRTRSENARSASSCHFETSRRSCWCSSSASAVCSASISDIDGTGKP